MALLGRSWLSLDVLPGPSTVVFADADRQRVSSENHDRTPARGFVRNKKKADRRTQSPVSLKLLAEPLPGMVPPMTHKMTVLVPVMGIAVLTV
jgi:hypothetical protein